MLTASSLVCRLALFGLFGSIGASIGEAIAGAMWTNMLYERLETYLPADQKDLAASIYASLETQLEYAGTHTGDAINDAYAYVMRMMVICGVCFIPLCVGCIFLWRNVNVKKAEEEKEENVVPGRREHVFMFNMVRPNMAGKDDTMCEDMALWMLDFDCVRRISMDERGL